MGEILLDWEGHNKALSNKLWEFLEEEYLVDFTVTCHGQQKKVHKFILVLLLPILKDALGLNGTIPIKEEELPKDGSPGETTRKPQCLNLDSVANHAEDMDYLIQFAYTGETTVPKEHAHCMLRIADSMGITSLKKCLFQWRCDGEHLEIPQSNDATTRFSSGSSQIQWNEESVDIDDIDLDMRPTPVIKQEPNIEESVDRVFSDLDIRPTPVIKQEPNIEESVDRVFSDLDIRTTPVIKQEPKNIEESVDRVSSDLDIPLIGDEESRLGSSENSIMGCDNEEKDKVTSNLSETVFTKEANSREYHESPSREYVCRICNVGFEKQTEYVAHRDTKCGTEYPTCKYCGHQTSQKYFLKRHIMAVHHVDTDGNPLEMNVKCTKCDFACYARHSLRAHVRIKHEHVGRFKCKECSFTAPSSNRLRMHERCTHKNIREFNCEECEKKFQTNYALNKHVLTVHLGVKPYVCDICGMKYKSKSSFNHHRNGHTDIVKFKHECDICGYRTKGNPSLKIHMRRDHGIDLNKVGKTKEKTLPVANFDLETSPTECTLDSM